MGVVYVVRHRSLRRADHRSRGVLPSVVCLCDLGTSKVWRLSSREGKKKKKKLKWPVTLSLVLYGLQFVPHIKEEK